MTAANTTTGLAMRMRLELAQLAVRHGVAPILPSPIPLTAPVDHDLVVEGLAASCDTDLARMRFRAYAFTLIPWATPPPLLVKHDPNQVAGKIDNLEYDDRGQLRVRATVTHPLARRMGAFSVTATVRAYELRDQDSAGFHAVITHAELDEVGLTDVPCNPEARVLHRWPASPLVAHYALMAQRVARLQQLTQLIQQQGRVQ